MKITFPVRMSGNTEILTFLREVCVKRQTDYFLLELNFLFFFKNLNELPWRLFDILRRVGWDAANKDANALCQPSMLLFVFGKRANVVSYWYLILN